MCAIAKIFGRGGRVFAPFSRSRDVLAGAAELEDGISAIWGRPGGSEKWVDDVAGVQSLNDGVLGEDFYPKQSIPNR
jgi:hypothetical protein